MGEQRARPRRWGCLTKLLILLLVIALPLGYAAWKVRLLKIPGFDPLEMAAARIKDAPVDAESSAKMTDLFKKAGVAGASSAVVDLPNGKGTAAIVVVDPSAGFKPAAGAEGKRKQATAIIKQLVEANKAGAMELQYVGMEYREGGQQVVSVGAPMNALNEFAAGRITEDQLLAQVSVRIHDIDQLVDRFIDQSLAEWLLGLGGK